MFVRRNQKFRLPRRATVPIIMIGPGTGLAPFRGFIQHRAAIVREGRECGENLLFFGCRHEKKDFIYEDELKEFEKEGIIQLYTAFSRDTVSFKKRNLVGTNVKTDIPFHVLMIAKQQLLVDQLLCPRLTIFLASWLMLQTYLQDKKVYVQHLMEQEALKLWELLEKGAHVYVCGYVNT